MKSTKIYSFLSLLIAFGMTPISAQQTPALAQSKSVLILNAKLHIGNGELIEKGVIGFSEGKITVVGSTSDTQVSVEDFEEVIDAEGSEVYPGFILCNTSLGLGEVNAVRASLDEQEIGSIKPNIRSIIAYNAESKLLETMRLNGILQGQVVPRGGLVSGTSSVVQFDAWNWEDAVVKENDGVHLYWPNYLTIRRGATSKNEDYQKQIESLHELISSTRAYMQGTRASVNLAYQATIGVVLGEINLYVHVNEARGILDALKFVRELGLSKVVLVGVEDGYKVASQIEESGIPVLLKAPHRLPSTTDESIKKSFELGAKFAETGILFSIDADDEARERMNDRNLPFYAGSFVGYGMEKEKAVQMITLNAAKILGIDSFTGSLETGKDATLFISKGDALDMRTNLVSKAFIQGRDIILESHQTTLYKRYNTKINGSD